MPDTLQALRAALTGRYDVERELGRGGMAVVYLGRDLRHDRQVAIKVFEHGTGAGDAERFLREIRVAARLQHPNILPVFDSGEAEGLLYYVMPYVAGASLRERLEREGALPIPDAIQVAREVALALDHAHREGVVHRDIKPDNIMLAGGVAVVADFGIARALESSKLTDTGMAIGTPAYMSPEQATASPVVDGRADLYSLGCVLYEMLAGAPPFSGPTGQAVMARHTADHVPPIGTIRTIDPALEATVVRALAKTPADRWPTGRAFADALAAGTRASTPPPASRRRATPALAAAAAVIILGAIALVARPFTRADAAEPRRSIAVLPFAAIGDSIPSGLGEGLMEAVITGLVRIEGLRVPSGGRVLALGERVGDVMAVGRELDVGAALSGTIQRSGRYLRLTVHLVNTADGVEIWSKKLDGEFSDVFQIQDSLTGQIVDALQLRLAPGSRAQLARGTRTTDMKAYELFLRARHETYIGTRESHARAKLLLDSALARDSLFADAWVALADVWGTWSSSALPAEAASVGRRAVERAIALDSSNADAFAVRAYLRLMFDWDFDGWQRDNERALRLAPASAELAMNYAGPLDLMNLPDSGLAVMRRAVALDATSPGLWANLAYRYLYAGMRDSAIEAAERAVRMDSTIIWAYPVLMNGHLAAGRRADADAAAAVLARAAVDQPGNLANLAAYYRRAGNRDGARAMRSRVEALARTQYVPFNSLAMARLADGDRRGALDALEQSARNHDLDLLPDMTVLGAELTGDPRFEALRRRIYGTRPLPPSPWR